VLFSLGLMIKNFSVFFNFSMVKTILALDLKAQQILRFNKHILGVNQIQKASQSVLMSKLVKHSWVSKQPRETTTIGNSSSVNE
jgi:hypothetical protein